MSIEREQPSTAFRSMPHYSNYGSTRFSGQPIDDLTGTFNALNETTNFRPQKDESTSIIHPQFQEASKVVIHPQFRTDLINPDSMRPVDSLSETFGDGDPQILGPLSGNGVFKPQDIDTKGSVIIGDDHFMPDRGGDSLTGEGRPKNVWTNGSATSFEDRSVGDYDTNDAVFDMRENIDWTAADGGNGSSWLTAKIASKANAYVDEDVDGFMKLGDIKGGDAITGEGRPTKIWTSGSGTSFEDRLALEFDPNDAQLGMRENFSGTADPGGTSFMTGTFEPAAGMNSFGESLNPVLEVGGQVSPGCTTFMTEKIGANPGQMLSPLSGGDGCPF
ncbi:hypothetical protein SynMITS9220_00862 [Synechococcus sp. MIT S9220]|nr:hypothetical protein SynMITS9220_00862 [Synechococcus sp. MIT S9220]